MKSKEEILRIFEVCRENGVKKCEIDGVVFHVEQLPSYSKPIERAAQDIISPLSVFEELNEDEMLYYSSPYYDEIQRQKDLRKEELNGKSN